MGDDVYAPERRPLATRERGAARPWPIGWPSRRDAERDFTRGHGGRHRRRGRAGRGVAFAARPPAFLAAAALIQLRLAANMFDGMVALETGRASPTGELFNEVPDRVSDAAMFIGAGYAAGGNPTLGYLAACLALFVTYVRGRGRWREPRKSSAVRWPSRSGPSP